MKIHLLISLLIFLKNHSQRQSLFYISVIQCIRQNIFLQLFIMKNSIFTIPTDTEGHKNIDIHRNFKDFRKRKSLSLGSAGSSKIINHHLATYYSETNQSLIKPKSQSAEKKPEKISMNTTINRFKAGPPKKRSHITDSTQLSFTRLINQKQSSTSSYNLTNNVVQSFIEPKKSSKTFRSKEETIKKDGKYKKNSGGSELKLKDDHILEWMNQILIESGQEVSDKSIRLAAVKNAKIDPSSLTTQHLSPQTISRIYRCLYVYSEGFSQFVKSICNHSHQVHLALWRVYSILIEHCSGGLLQTTLSKLRVENQKIIQSLKEQIQLKQSIIDHNDELNKQKNLSIHKEIKNLSHQNEQLTTQKTFMLNSIVDTEKAFGDQLSLRLLFEQKINSIHYAYRQISDKHNLLLRDFRKIQEENQELKRKNKEYQQENEKLKKDNWGFQDLHKHLKNEIRTQGNILKKYQEESLKSSQLNNQEKSQKMVLVSELLESRHKIARLEKEHQNTQATLKMISSSYHQLRSQYQQSLNENKRLVTALEQQNEVNSKNFELRRNLTEEQVTLENEKYFIEMKFEKKDNKILELMQRQKEMSDTINQLESQREIMQERVEQFESQRESAIKTIEMYKQTENTLELTLSNKEKYIQALEAEKIKRESLLTQLRSEISIVKNDLLQKEKVNQELTLELQRIREENIKITSTNEDLTVKNENQVNELKLTNKKIQKSLIQKQFQLERYKEQYQQMSFELNSQKFQRKTLDISYKHSLTVLQNNESIKKELKTTISELEEKLQVAQLQMKIFHQKYEAAITKFQEQKDKLLKRNALLQTEAINLKGYIHPMIYEDLRSLFLTNEVKEEELQQRLKYLTEQFSIKEQYHQKVIEKKDSSLSSLQKKIKELKAQNILDIEYQKKKQVDLFAKIQDLQMQLLTSKSKEKMPAGQFKQQQKKYLQVIKEKTQRIEYLIKETESAHDQYYQLNKKISETKIEVMLKNQQIEDLRKQLHKLNQEKSELIEQKEEMGREKNVFLEKIRVYQELELSQELRQSLKITEKPLTSSQRPPEEEDIRVSLLNRQTRHSKRPNRRVDLLTGNEIQTTEYQKDIQFERRVDFAAKMKNAAIYYSK